jgi:hypothetical protein
VPNVPHDEDINTDHTSSPSTPTTAGPITRARARKVNHQVSSFLSSCPSCLDLGDTCTLVLLGIKEKTEREKDSRRLDSDCSTPPTCDGCHGYIRTRIGVILDLLES